MLLALFCHIVALLHIGPLFIKDDNATYSCYRISSRIYSIHSFPFSSIHFSAPLELYDEPAEFNNVNATLVLHKMQIPFLVRDK